MYSLPTMRRSRNPGKIDSRLKKVEITKTLTYVSDGDTGGACYWLGTSEGLQAWSNPHTAGKLTCLLSTSFDGTDLPGNLVDRQPNQRPATKNIANSWLGIDFGTTRKLKCNYYSLRGRDFTSDHLRNWQFQGSNNFTNWTTLDTQTNNTTINQNTWLSLAIASGVAYRYLRIIQTEVSSTGGNVMTLGEFEFYGDLITV